MTRSRFQLRLGYTFKIEFHAQEDTPEHIRPWCQVFLGVDRFWFLRDIDAVADVESLGCWGKESRCSAESSFDFLPVLSQGVRHGNRFMGILPVW